MNFQNTLLPLAIIALWVPAALISPSQVKLKLRQATRRHNDGVASLLRSKLNWVDLIRAGAGAWIVQHAVFSYTAGQDDLETVFKFVQLAVLFIGVIAQTVWITTPFRVIGPLFFLTGLTLVISGPLLGGFALLLGLTCALMLRRLTLAFIFVPGALVVFGFLFRKLGMTTIFNAGLFGFPLFVSFAAATRLAFVRYPSKSSVSSFTEGIEIRVPIEPLEDTVIRPDFRVVPQQAQSASK